MKHTIASIGLCLGLVFAGTAGFAEDWKILPGESKIAFGSVKKDTVGESHHFGSVGGGVDGSGQVTVMIDLSSVETWIDIRNERIMEHVFGGSANATITAAIDIAALQGLADGATTTVTAKGNLSLNGAQVPVEGDMFVARLSEDRVLVTTDEMIMVGTDELGINAGVDMLMQLAKLPGITRVTPVTMRLVLQK